MLCTCILLVRSSNLNKAADWAKKSGGGREFSSNYVRAQADQCCPAKYTTECCFKYLKTNGFDLENQNLAQVHQVEILTALLAWLYTVCVAGGIIEQQEKLELGRRIKFKTYKNQKKSLDRLLFNAGLT